MVFHLVLSLPGQAPLHFAEPMESVEACLEAARAFLTRPTNSVLLDGGQLQAGCVVTAAPSIEH